MKKPAGIACVLLAFFAALAGAADAPLKPVADPHPILDDLQRKMASVHSVYLEFTEERHYQSLSDEPLKNEGVMLIDRPDQVRWEYTAPYQSIFLGNRKSVAQFEFTDGKWKKLDLGFPQMLKRVTDQMSLMHQGRLDALTSDYTISAATNDTMVALTLVPKEENVRSTMPSLEIHLLPDLSATHEVVMHQSGGDFTRIIFHREVRDVTFPTGTFDQTKPLDIAAIKQAAAGHAP
jgi:outer membrane lipoprotein-sorting protein